MKMFKRCMAVVLAVCLCITSSSIASAASKTVTVATQAQLNKAVKAGTATAIKIVTKKAVKFTIPAGAKTKNMKLTVNAPKAEIVNKAQFKSITLGGKTVKRYVENGKNNVITITADMASFRVTKSTAVKKLTLKGKKANVQVNKGSKVASVAAAKKGATLNIRVNGSVGKLEALSMAAKLNVRGNAKKIPVVIDARNVVLTANATVDVLLKDEAKIVLAKGSEDSTIAVNNSGDAEVVNKTKEDVVVTTPAGEVTVEAGESVETTVVPEEIPEPTPTPNTPSTGGSTGGNSGNGGGSKPTPPQTVKVTGVTVSQAAVTLKVGETTTLTAIVAPENATDKTVTWSSNKPEVATVDENSGLVTAKAAGTATITVTTKDGNITATCTVTVKDDDKEDDKEDTTNVSVENVSLSETELELEVNATKTLTAMVTPNNATDKTVTWSSSDEKVATVDKDGLVTAKAVGEATITVTTTDGNKTATCKVTVNEVTSTEKEYTVLEVGLVPAPESSDNAAYKKNQEAVEVTTVSNDSTTGELTVTVKETGTLQEYLSATNAEGTHKWVALSIKPEEEIESLSYNGNLLNEEAITKAKKEAKDLGLEDGYLVYWFNADTVSGGFEMAVNDKEAVKVIVNFEAAPVKKEYTVLEVGLVSAPESSDNEAYKNNQEAVEVTTVSNDSTTGELTVTVKETGTLQEYLSATNAEGTHKWVALSIKPEEEIESLSYNGNPLNEEAITKAKKEAKDLGLEDGYLVYWFNADTVSGGFEMAINDKEAVKVTVNFEAAPVEKEYTVLEVGLVPAPESSDNAAYKKNQEAVEVTTVSNDSTTGELTVTVKETGTLQEYLSATTAQGTHKWVALSIKPEEEIESLSYNGNPLNEEAITKAKKEAKDLGLEDGYLVYWFNADTVSGGFEMAVNDKEAVKVIVNFEAAKTE